MSELRNKRMQQKLDEGDCVDVSRFPTYGGAFILPPGIYQDGLDYCDALNERWIWSIGRRKSDGTILASCRDEFYRNSEYECLWLR